MYKSAFFFALFGAACAGLTPATLGVSYSSAPAVSTSYSSLAAVPVTQHVVAAPQYHQQVVAAPQYTQQVFAAPAVRQVAAAQPTIVRAAAPVAVAQPTIVRAAAPVVRQVAVAQPTIVRQVAAPVAVAKAVAPEPFDPNPQYSYGYQVSDSLTGDSKSASETRNGDSVQGEYSLVEPDGSIRRVTYTADAINGFNAVVERQAGAVVAKAVAAPVAVAQPTVVRAAPVAVAQPQFVRAAPVAVAQPTLVRAATPVVSHVAAAPAFRQVAVAQPTFARVAAPAVYAQPAVATRVVAQQAPAVVSTTFGSPFASYSY